MDKLTLTLDNIGQEHICCALDSKTSNIGVKAKKDWLSARIPEGLKFTKLNARGKVFIEYIPSEMGWVPIEAKNYILINCHWVSGSYKGNGYGTQLLQTCEDEARRLNRSGVIVIVGSKKKPYLSDKSFYLKNGYTVTDTAAPHFELMVKKFDDKSESPRFKQIAKSGILANDIKGIDIFYTAQCPFTVPYVDMLKPVILSAEIPVRVHQIQSREEAQNHCCPITTYSIFVNGKFHSHEILTPKKLEQLIDKTAR